MHQPATISPTERNFGNYLKLYFKGVAMGTADLIPGVSGGTMALILGIYEDLITSLKKLSERAVISKAVRLNLKGVLSATDWRFLATLGLGILTAILSLSRGIGWLLTSYQEFVFSFFFGLILASVYLVSRRVGSWDTRTYLSLVFGATFAFFIVGITPAATPEGLWFIVFSGAVAVCALVLPGISGAFILVLLGKYEVVLHALKEADVAIIFSFVVGAAAGLISFVRVLSWLLRNYHDVTLALLCGFMFGGLRKVWPWQEAQGHGSTNVLPSLSLNGGQDLAVLWSIGLIVLGLIVVLLLERPGRASPSGEVGT
jgi:putative membrane protein